MAGVAQLVRASDCGPEGRWFDSSHPPHSERQLAVFPRSLDDKSRFARRKRQSARPEHRLQTVCGYRTAVSIQVFQTWDEVSTTSTRTSEIFGLVVRYYRGDGLFFVGKLMCYNETGGHLAKFI